MSLDTFLTIVSLVGFVLCWVGYRHLSENVHLTYKDQRIPYNGKEIKR